ncbi:MAG TPA: dihydropyrimidinase [Ramlibacter sp.]|uniref:dihydropyrimidinase n=1 Tax=Ramlibacter sp. TaxID=1917967 RepID=UPI002C884967|nr:dihydropyrimidinase [Ramlibacter sp.]HVZ44884.1 dihydropyrimidinase [Ramlibacter sp.]
MNFDLVVRGGRVSTAQETFDADIGVFEGRVVALGSGLARGRREIDATGKWVLPGGIDSHCHVEQLSGMGRMCADDFHSATVSAAFGGTTTIIPFAAQHRGNSVLKVVADYHACAGPKAVVDYGFHLILTDPTPDVLGRELPIAIREGLTSLKVYTTYDALRLDDFQLLEVMDAADRGGAMVMVHAENHDVIRWISKRLLERGHVAPRFHTVAHDALAEAEATHRVIHLARVLDVPLLIVHVSGREAAAAIHDAQVLGVRIYGETCPQYLFLTADDADREGLEGAKYCCSPPPRDAQSQEALWRGLRENTFQVFSSDHAPYRFDESGKLPKGDKTTFKEMANGVPGLELRMPLLFSEGVLKGRISIEQFVALTATNHAAIYGLAGRKGSIAEGLDADLAIWDPERVTQVRAADLHDNVGYTPYEGMTLRGWPETVMSRGRVVVAEGELHAERGSGLFLQRGPSQTVSTRHDVSGRRDFFRTLVR